MSQRPAGSRHPRHPPRRQRPRVPAPRVLSNRRAARHPKTVPAPRAPARPGAGADSVEGAGKGGGGLCAEGRRRSSKSPALGVGGRGPASTNEERRERQPRPLPGAGRRPRPLPSARGAGLLKGAGAGPARLQNSRGSGYFASPLAASAAALARHALRPRPARHHHRPAAAEGVAAEAAQPGGEGEHGERAAARVQAGLHGAGCGVPGPGRVEGFPPPLTRTHVSLQPPAVSATRVLASKAARRILQDPAEPVSGSRRG